MNISVNQTSAIKGVAVLMMLFHHLIAFPDRIPDYSPLKLIASDDFWVLLGVFSKICVPVFFFISGYGFSVKGKTSFSYYINKVFGFYKSYVFYFICWCLLGFYVFHSAVYPHSGELIFQFSYLNLLFGLFALDSTYNPEAWFAEIYIYLLLLMPLMLRINLMILTILSLFIYFLSFSLFLLNINIPVIALFDLLFWQISFVLGIVCYHYNFFLPDKFHLFESKLIRIFCFFILISLSFFLWFIFKKNILVFITPLFIFSLYQVFLDHTLITRIFSFIGKYSLPIWLIHPFFCYYFFQDFIYSFTNLFYSYTALLVLSFITAFIMEKIRTILYFLIKTINSYLTSMARARVS